MYDFQLRALARAWLTTVICLALLGGAVAVDRVWDTQIFGPALHAALLSEGE